MVINLFSLPHYQVHEEVRLKIDEEEKESDETKFLEFEKTYSKKFSELLFETGHGSFEDKMENIKKLAKTTRLLIGFKNMDEYQSAKDNLKSYGVDVVQPKFYQRKNYFHVLAKLVPASIVGVHTLEKIPPAFGQEIVKDDASALIESGFESLGNF